jgi:apolipoprotein D and lipocalin family protein
MDISPAMLKRLTVAVLAATALFAQPAFATTQPVEKLELSKMMGRWYEIARLPNMLQKGCQAGASDWTRSAEGFSVVQSCHKGAPDGPLAQWRAKARVADPSNARFRMSFFGGVVSQDYAVLDHREEQGWLLLATRDGKYLWLMAQRPTLSASVRNAVVSRIRQLGRRRPAARRPPGRRPPGSP